MFGRNFIEWLPPDFEDLHGLREAFQLKRTDPLEEIGTAPAAHHPDGIRDQDLTGIGAGTEPSRLYHRIAVIVAGLHCRLSTTESYP